MTAAERDAIVMLMARAMFATACCGKTVEYGDDRRRYYEPKARAVLVEFEKGGDDLEERATEASFIASNNPMGWRYADHCIYYRPAACAALACAEDALTRRGQSGD